MGPANLPPEAPLLLRTRPDVDQSGPLRRGHQLEPFPKLLELTLQQHLPGLGVRARGDDLLDSDPNFVSPTTYGIHTSFPHVRLRLTWQPPALS